jgi:hypothetical protein
MHHFKVTVGTVPTVSDPSVPCLDCPVLRRTEARVKAQEDRETAEFNRRLREKMKAEAETPKALAQKFEEMHAAELQWQPSIQDRILQRKDEAKREAVETGVELGERW